MSGVIHEFGELGFFYALLVVLLVECVLRVGLAALTRTYRLVMITARGWPPPHLDADGDWKPDEEAGA